MAYYEGETLEKKIYSGRMEVQTAVNITSQIARGLAKAHERGITHRDLKPANIIITKDGTAKIIDFGLAKLSTGAQLTRSGTSLGTAAYMSPEQARGETADAASDLWSLGIIMYQMATGKLPYEGEYEAIVLYKILNETPEPIRRLNPDIPPMFEGIAGKAMQKDPASRYRNASEIVEDLNEGREPVPAPPSQAHTTAKPRRTYLVSRRFLFLATGGIFVAALVAVLSHVNPFGTTREYRSLLILPIVNRGDQLNEYLADGISKELISRISRSGIVRVISSRTSFLYKNSSQDDETITESLAVDGLIRGTLSVESGHAEVALTLFDKKQKSAGWSKIYQHSSADIVGLVNEIVADISSILSLRPTNGDRLSEAPPEIYDLYLRALYHASKDLQSDNRLAQEYLAETLRKDSLFVPALLRMSEIKLAAYESAWDIRESVLGETESLCNRALKGDSTSPAALVLLGRIQNLQGNKQEAIRFWDLALEREPLNTSAITQLAQVYLFDLNEPARGVVYLKRLQEADPTDWYNMSNVGVGYGQLKDYQSAIYWFRQSITLNPHNDLSWINLGFTMDLTGKLDSAVQCYQRALSENPQNLTAYENAVSDLIAMGEFARAESVLQPGAKLLTSNHKFLYLLGVTRSLGKKNPEAEQIFQNGVRLTDEEIRKNPNIAENVLFRGMFSARLGRRSDAAAAARSAYSLDSTNSETAIKIARIYSVLRNKPAMIDWFRRAKSMNPEYDETYLSLAIDFEEYRTDPDLLFVARQR